MLAFKRSAMTLSEYKRQKDEEFDIKDPYLYQHILNICCQVTGTDTIMALSKNRKIEVVFARFLTIFFMQKIVVILNKKKKKDDPPIYYTLTQLGEMIGGKSHADVIWGIKTVEGVIETNSPSDRRTAWFFNAKDKIETGLNIKF